MGYQSSGPPPGSPPTQPPPRKPLTQTELVADIALDAHAWTDAKLKRAVLVLRAVEWAGDVSGDRACCPLCDAWEPIHEEGCQLAAVLKENSE